MKSEEKRETDFKRNYIKQYSSDCIAGPITYRNAIFDNNSTKKAQKWGGETRAMLE